MAKPRLTLRVRIPPYAPPLNAWRRQLHSAIQEAQRKREVTYRTADRLEIRAKIYMGARHLRSNDVDNRLKDILDALQGRAGGSKATRFLAPIIPNDNQVFRVTIEKAPAVPQSRGLGHLTISRFRSS